MQTYTDPQDGYLFFKWENLQAMALVSREQVDGIAKGTPVGEEMDIWADAIDPLDRAAHRIGLIDANTEAGAMIKERVAAWLNDGALADLLQPLLAGPLSSAADKAA
jgi:hypothetical protein